ncbi:hypothetical protein AX769_08410 [Frondihabitans sp. PAMC 28766]|uniref:alpha/beta hydrolase fold domain-containing protein n=1 Tax=Frondihabitans sp. PAMC 28766 TaxID=1795630 RepID=UPI00078CEC15|nr:alpha/beta hydrolase fold domain-containing protein [Frondihabitans sp. PAMC 28766]AMM20183.1 hypothetical protein AX769_08410 [Frondihabitans sp. PAMC 28766]
MRPRLDTEIAAILRDAGGGILSAASRGDVHLLRAFEAQRAEQRPAEPGRGVQWTEQEIRYEGVMVRARWYVPAGVATGAAVVFLHGGGRVMGSIDQCHTTVVGYVARSGVPFLSVDYRLAPEWPGTPPGATPSQR